MTDKEQNRAEEPEIIDDLEGAAGQQIADEAEAAAAEEEERGEAGVETPAGPEDECEELKSQLAESKKEYLFLMAEFDNFRKRTLKEKSEIIKNAGEQVFKGLLPILDDFERGIKATEDAGDSGASLEGMKLIYNKLVKYLAQNGVKEMDPDDRDFNPDRHEAISVLPVGDEQKGKILDTVEKGYTINDKVLRHAKVVVGQ